MLANNTNKVVWVGVAVGLVAVIGAGALTLFPDAFSGMKTTISSVMTTKANADKTSVTVDGVVDDYDTSNHYYNLNTSAKTASISTYKSGKEKDKDAVVVPSYVTNNGVKYTVTAIDTSAYYSSEVTSVVIPDTIKTIGNYAFVSNSKLKSVTIGKNVETIGNYAFQKTALSSVTIPDSVKTIGKQAFDGIPNNKDGFASIGKNTTYNTDGYSSSFGSHWDSKVSAEVGYKPTIRNY